MRKELTFQCWNCSRTYNQTTDLTVQERLIVSCPHCRVEAVVDLSQFKDAKKIVMRGNNDEEQNWWDALPEILQTRQME